MYNRQFIQFARIPVEIVARLWDISTQKYNNFSIATVILGYLLLISPWSLNFEIILKLQLNYFKNYNIQLYNNILFHIYF